jgi:uncharacterized membrane protein YciS (DUF1049 family)
MSYVGIFILGFVIGFVLHLKVKIKNVSIGRNTGIISGDNDAEEEEHK